MVYLLYSISAHSTGPNTQREGGSPGLTVRESLFPKVDHADF